MGAAASREGDAARTAAREQTRRCRERRRLMREAVRLRGHLAASNAAYLRSLGAVASALTRFAAAEPLAVSDHTAPAVIVHRPLAPSSPPLLRSIGGQREAQAAQLQADGAAQTTTSGTRTEGVAVGGEEELRLVVRHHTLAEVAAGLEEYFLKAGVAGDDVSGLLEASSTEFKGGTNSFLLCSLSAPSVAQGRIDSMNDRQRHSFTLQQLMAWEKKLYKEVKARERLQVRHDKKLAELRDQEYSRKINVDIQKLKAAWDRARAQLAAASQAVDASASATAELRDAHLARQLLELCHATLGMWSAMRQHHEAQNVIAQQLRGLSSRTSTEPTAEIHYKDTRALEAAMNAWCAAMGHMAKHQRDYVHAVHGWLALTLAPADGAAEASPVAAELAAFVGRWAKALDRVHCVDAVKSIKNFAGAARALHGLQSYELRVGRRVRRESRELDRKSRMLRQVERSYYDSYMPPGLSSLWHWGRPGLGREEHMQARHEVAQRQDEIAACRKTVEDEMRRHAKAIDATKSATVSTVQGTLPAVFQAMAAFSASLASALEAVCRQPQTTHMH